MTQDASNRARQAFRLKGTMPALTMLCLMTEDIEAIERQLVNQLSQMPQFFLHAPVVVDLEVLGDARLDLARLGDVLRRHQLVPVAVRHASSVQEERAVRAGWGILRSSAAALKSSSAGGPIVVEPEGKHVPRPPQADEPTGRPLAGLTVRTPVRSGQVVHAAGGDLVVLAPVSSGAELIADGNIHVYAPLRGRALAGASDNPEASIFCLHLEAEFLAIGGHYLMADEIPKERRGKAARIHLEHEQLVITPL